MTKTSFTIKWQPPENDGGTPITEYIVEMKEESKKSWQKVIEEFSLGEYFDENSKCILLITLKILFTDRQHKARNDAVERIGSKDRCTVQLQDNSEEQCWHWSSIRSRRTNFSRQTNQ